MKRIGSLALLLLTAWVPRLAAREVVIDLAAQNPGSTERRPVEPGEELVIAITNRVPTKTYDVTIERKIVTIPVLSLPSGAPAAETCDNLVGNFVLELQQKKDEVAVGGLVSEYRKKVSPCPANIQQQLDQAIRAQTVKVVPDTYKLELGEELVVTVTRKDESKSTWITEFSTGSRGEWRTSYGFNFIPNKDETYFSKEKGAGEFQITRDRERKKFDFSPSVFFTWLSRQQQQKDWAIGPVAGMGFDSSNPVIFGGISFSYNQNVQLNLGAVVHQQKRLNGRFQQDQIVKENLGSDQLQLSTYQINWFFGLSFRLDKSPFGNQDKGTKK
jgi:hypothetical protein